MWYFFGSQKHCFYGQYDVVKFVFCYNAWYVTCGFDKGDQYEMNKYNGMEVEVIKLGLRNIEDLGISSKDALGKSVVWLREKYEMTGDVKYLDKAIWHIYAYLEMGYPYESGKEEFQAVLDALGEKEEDVFPKRSWGSKKIPLKKMRINQLLGKWNPGLHSMKISDAVEDIIEKARNRQIGEYTYHCGRVKHQL